MSKEMVSIKSRSARKLLKATAEEGRGGDSVLAHVAIGEVVIPVTLTTNAEFKAMLDKVFAEAGIDINKYTVGHKSNSINPDTGLPEFGWFKKLFGFSSKSLLPIALGAGAGYFLGPMLGMGTAATATTAAVPASTAGALAGAKLGATVAGVQSVTSNAEKARAQAAEASAAAIANATKAREEAAAQAAAARELAASEAAKNREAAAEQAKLTREQQAALAAEQSKMIAAQIAAQRESATSALSAAQLSASQQAEMMKGLTAQQAAAAEAAKAQLFQQQKQYEEQKAMMEKQAKDQAAALDAERRKIAERESAQMTARRRAGRRSLLSTARINPELGLAPAANDETQLKTLLGA